MSGKSTAFSQKGILNCRGKKLDLNAPKIMGILNLTADSFFDGGKNIKDDYYLTKAEGLIKEGISILDIGAASTRPGSLLIDSHEEWAMLEKPLQKLRKRFPDLIFSIDTYHSSTAQKAADLGIEMINDISGGTIDKQMFKVVGANKLAYVLMHIQGTPETMQQNPIQIDIYNQVESFFTKQLMKLEAQRVESVLLDPGFGFGKSLDQNYVLLKEMKRFEHFNWPILAGLSRKSMIFKYLETNPNEALNGTSVLNTFALLNGANILRVHDAKEANETINLFLKYKQS